MNKNIKSVAFGIILMVSYITLFPDVSSAQVDILNNNVNNNINNNTATVRSSAPAPIIYAGTLADQTRGNYNYTNLNNIAYRNLPTVHQHTQPIVQRVARCTTCTHSSYRLVNHNRCGAVITIEDTQMPKPICSLAPSITPSGAIELQWVTVGATIAFIDSGIGHVNTISGSRVVTPTKDTAYNMTVLNDAGIAGSCGAVINVKVAVDTINPVSQINPVDTSGSVNPSQLVDQSDPNTGTGGLFGDAFRSIAIPIGIVFLILIVLLIFIMSKVKGSK